MFNKNKPVLGLDIGNVISEMDTDTRHQSLLQHEIPGAATGVRELYRRFDGQVALVSKYGVVTQVRTREWLERSAFYQRTGIQPNHVFFCKERKDKAVICEYLGVTHFVDDRLEVLSYLKSVPKRFLFRPTEREVSRYKEYLSLVVRVDSWEELLKKM